MHTRSKRTVQRVPLARMRLTERDRWLLEGLAIMRFLTTSQIAKVYFNGSRWYPNKRLRNLLDAGLIKVWVGNLSEENVYSITKSGLAVIGERNDLRPETKVPYGLDENLDHLLAINDVRTSLAITLTEANAEIVWWRSDWELRSHGRERIVPDGLFIIKWHGLKEQPYALEVDNNTRSSRNFLKKILAYDSAQTLGKGIYGVSNPVVLVVGSDPKWLDRYRASIRKLRPAGRIWFAAIEEIKPKGAAGIVWGNGDEKKYSLRELTFCPYSKDRFHYETLNK